MVIGSFRMPCILRRFLKTDTQGMDFEIIRSAGDSLKKVQYLFSETFCSWSAYKGARNDYATEWCVMVDMS